MDNRYQQNVPVDPSHLPSTPPSTPALPAHRLVLEEFAKEITAHVSDLTTLADKIFGPTPVGLEGPGKTSGNNGELAAMDTQCGEIWGALAALGQVKSRLARLA